MDKSSPTRWRAWIRVVVILDVIFLLAWLFAPTITRHIDPSIIFEDHGYSYWAPLDLRTIAPYEATGDTPRGRGSFLRLLEDGEPLGPPHTPHHLIRNTGKGSYSHWNRSVYFASSDNSDPRTNGRDYRVKVQTQMRQAVVWAVLAFNLVLIVLFPKAAWSGLKHYHRTLLSVLVLAAALRIFLPLLGWGMPLDQTLPVTSDPALVLQIFLHQCLGLALAAFWFIAGGAAYLTLTRRFDAPIAEVVLGGYMLGFLIVLTLALIAQFFMHGWFVVAISSAVMVAQMTRWHPRAFHRRHTLTTLAATLPFVLLFSGTSALWWHGPTNTLPGAPIGDMSIYVGSMMALSYTPQPMAGLALEGLPPLGVSNKFPSLLGAVLAGTPGFDPFLFFSASLSVFYLLYLFLSAFCLLNINSEPTARPVSDQNLIAATLLLVAAVKIPTFIAESPPVVFLPPVIFSLLFVVKILPFSSARAPSALLIAVAGPALSKVVAFAVTGPFALLSVVNFSSSNLSKYAMVTLFAIGTLTSAWVAYMVWNYLPLFWVGTAWGPQSLRILEGDPTTTEQWVTSMRDLGIIALMLGSLVLREKAVGLSVICGGMFFLLIPTLFGVLGPTTSLLIAAFCLHRAEIPSGAARWLILAAALHLPFIVTEDWGGWWIGLVWVVCVGLGVTTVLSSRLSDRRKVGSSNDLRIPSRIGVAGFFLLALWIWTATDPGQRLRASQSLERRPNAEVLTPSLRDIWLAVRGDTAVDALIFTDQTGMKPSRLSGWNDYALTAGRQFFIASWQHIGAGLRSDEGKRRALINKNTAVLEGEIAPQDLELSRTYSSYYAVVDADHKAPTNFERVYGNEDYVLYQIQPR